MKKFIIGMIAVSTFGLSTAYADIELKVGASVGSVKTELDDTAVAFDATDFGWKIFGNFMLTDNFGVEASYIDLGKPDDTILGTNYQFESSAFGAFAVGALTATDLINVFGKIGVVSWDTEISVDNLPSLSDDGTDLAYGVGVAFEPTDALSIRGEWEIFDIEDADAVWMFSVGIAIGF